MRMRLWITDQVAKRNIQHGQMKTDKEKDTVARIPGSYALEDLAIDGGQWVPGCRCGFFSCLPGQGWEGRGEGWRRTGQFVCRACVECWNSKNKRESRRTRIVGGGRMELPNISDDVSCVMIRQLSGHIRNIVRDGAAGCASGNLRARAHGGG